MKLEIFNKIESDENLAEEKAEFEATNKMLGYLAGSPNRRIILMFFSREKDILKIKKYMEKMLNGVNINIKRTLEDLKKDGLIEEIENGKIFKLTERGEELAKIFKISRKVF